MCKAGEFDRTIDFAGRFGAPKKATADPSLCSG
jgi:hypothetical protein